MKTMLALILALLASVGIATAAPQSSISKLAFGPTNTLFAADWKAGRVYAYHLEPAASVPDQPFNLLNLQAALAGAVGSQDFRIQDLAMRPGSNEVYIALAVGSDATPYIVRVTPSGMATTIDLSHTPSTSVALDRAGGDLMFWNTLPETAYTVTDMKWHNGHLYVAGLANQRFSSTLRILSYPFGKQAMASVEMYHTVHNQWETRAPIRAMTFATIDGVDTLLGGYLCSPLVSIPVASLVDGAHVKAKTLGELGVAGIPSSMFVYDQPDMASGKSYPFLLVNERYRSSLAIPLGGIAKVNSGAGVTTPPPMTAPPGANLGAMLEAFDGVLYMDNQSSQFFIALRRNLETGAAQLVSYDKAASFRLSDADVAEYDFPDYKYDAPFQRKYILPLQNMLKREEGYPEFVIPSAASIPEATLRMSIVFSQPQDPSVAEHIRLRQQDGSHAYHPFVDQPLWSADGKTLTLLLDPSRQKLGLSAHNADGFVLKANQRVDLVLDDTVIKTWSVVAGSCAPLDPSKWRISSVRAGTKDPLIVQFSAPIDGLSAEYLAIANADSTRASGDAALTKDERAWSFVPATPWQQGNALAVYPRLEDPCGNEVGEPLEHVAGTGLGSERQTTFIPIHVGY